MRPFIDKELGYITGPANGISGTKHTYSNKVLKIFLWKKRLYFMGDPKTMPK